MRSLERRNCLIKFTTRQKKSMRRFTTYQQACPTLPEIVYNWMRINLCSFTCSPCLGGTTPRLLVLMREVPVARTFVYAPPHAVWALALSVMEVGLPPWEPGGRLLGPIFPAQLDVNRILVIWPDSSKNAFPSQLEVYQKMIRVIAQSLDDRRKG